VVCQCKGPVQEFEVWHVSARVQGKGLRCSMSVQVFRGKGLRHSMSVQGLRGKGLGARV
jgi:hypothetical protein